MKELKKRIGLIKNGAGFTLIELLLVTAIMGLMAVASAVSFKQFTEQQNLNAATDTVRNTLNEVKSNTSSQRITNGCNVDTKTLIGHEMRVVSGTPNSLEIYEVCFVNSSGTENTYPVKTVKLPSNITVSASANPIRFLVLTGAATISTVTVKYGARERLINVYSSGIIE